MMKIIVIFLFFTKLGLVYSVLPPPLQSTLIDTASACACQCVPDFSVVNNATGEWEGNCKSSNGASNWCFIDSFAAKHCTDSAFDTRLGIHWSSEACFTPTPDQDLCQEVLTPKTPDHQGECTIYLNGFIFQTCYVTHKSACLECLTSGENLATTPIWPCHCLGIEPDFDRKPLTNQGMELECFPFQSASFGRTLQVTTSAGGLQSVRSNNGWKAKRQCRWKLVSGSYACVRG